MAVVISEIIPETKKGLLQFHARPRVQAVLPKEELCFRLCLCSGLTLSKEVLSHLQSPVIQNLEGVESHVQ